MIIEKVFKAKTMIDVVDEYGRWKQREDNWYRKTVYMNVFENQKEWYMHIRYRN